MLSYSKRFINLILLFFLCVTAKANIIVNEIFPAPDYQKLEWIELFNNSKDTAFLQNGFINDAKTVKGIPNLKIPPRYYAILVKDTSDFQIFWQRSDSVIFYQVSLPTLNNDKDIVVIRDNDSTIIDSISYTFKSSKKGISLERIKADIYFDFDNNWDYSESPDSSTPGRWNSISNEKSDVSLIYSKSNDKDVIKVIVQNNVPAIIENLRVFMDKNNDGIYDSTEIIVDYDLKNQIITDSLNFEINLKNWFESVELYGDIYFYAIVSVKNDKNPENNSLIFYKTNDLPHSVVKFNEILFDNGDDMSDFVELVNTGEVAIALNNLKLFKVESSNEIELHNFVYPSPILKPEQFIVISSDSRIFNLFPELIGNNCLIVSGSEFKLSYYGDKLILKNSIADILDFIEYSRSWYGSDNNLTENISIEKINPNLESNSISSWASSKSMKGSTPLAVNSVFQDFSNMNGDFIKIEPNPFTPLGEGNNYCLIQMELSSSSTIDAFIYNENGTLVKTLARNEKMDKMSTLIWDGRNDEGYLLDVGVYVLIIEVVNGNHSDTYKKLIILAK